ncbi:MAG: AI-2E family transporter [Xanthobacteraceae bacterium]
MLPASSPKKFPVLSKPIPQASITTILVGVVVVAALYFGREVLVPIALAILLSFILSPFVRLLQRWYLPRVIAVTVVGLVAFSGIFGLGTLMVSQVNGLARDLPRYQTTLGEKIDSLRGAAAGTGTLERASEVLRDLSQEINKPKDNSGVLLRGRAAPDKPIPVEVRQPDPGALQTLTALIEPLIHPLTTTGIVVIFVIFILLQHQDLRNRLVRLAGAKDLQRTTAAIDDAGERLSRLFLTQLGLNACFGLIIGMGLWFIGVPSAPLWGMLAMILRFVPYIGAVISAIFPLILAAAVGSGWTMVLSTAALFLVVEVIAGQVIEPLVYGRSAGLSPVAVIASATFWTWLWGPVGLILATPLTICLVVLGRHVEHLKFLEVMFGDDPPLKPAELIYQRMLARDPIEAAEQARLFLQENTLSAFYDEILLEGLHLAQDDAERGLLDNERMQRVRDAVAEIVDDLGTHVDKDEVLTEDVASNTVESPLARLERAEAQPIVGAFRKEWQTGTPVLCIPGLGLLDEAAALMIAQLLNRRGIGARVEHAEALSMSRIMGWDIKGVALVCLCYVGAPSSAQVRYAVRRIRRRTSEIPTLIALLGASAEMKTSDILEREEFVQHSLSATVDRILAIANDASEKAHPAAFLSA